MDTSHSSGNGSQGGGGGGKSGKAEGALVGSGKRGKTVKESVWAAYLKVLKDGDEDRKMWRVVGADEKACTYKSCKISEEVVVKCYKQGCSKVFHPSCALAGTYAFVDLKDDAHFRFYCPQHGSPCLYCICRRQFGEGDADMIECARCKEWYHCSCMGLNLTDFSDKDVYVCPPCKRQAPPASKIKDNKVKEAQYDRHDEVGAKIKGIKTLWDKLHRLEPHPQTQKVGKAVSEEEFKSLLARLNDKEGWPLGLEAVRQATLKRLKKVQDDIAAWTKRASFELDKSSVFQNGGKTGVHKWICTKEHMQHDTRALQTLLSQAAVFPYLPQKVHASVEATSHALQWALQCLEVTDFAAPFVVSMEQLKDLVPRENQASIGHVTDSAAKKRILKLLEVMFPIASRAFAWEAAVTRALKGGKDRKIGRPQLAALEQEYAKTRVRDDEKPAKVQELADNIGSWEERAVRALESKHMEELTALQEEANNALKNHKLDGREGVMQLHGELEWVIEAQAALGGVANGKRPLLDDVESLLEGDAWENAQYLLEEMKPLGEQIEAMLSEAQAARKGLKGRPANRQEAERRLAVVKGLRVEVPEEEVLSLLLEAEDKANSKVVPVADLKDFLARVNKVEDEGADLLKADAHYKVLASRWAKAKELAARTRKVAEALKRDGNEATYDSLAQEQEKLFLQAQEVGVTLPELGGKLREGARKWWQEAQPLLTSAWPSVSDACAKLSTLQSSWVTPLAPSAQRTKVAAALEAAVLLERAQGMSTDKDSAANIEPVLQDLTKVLSSADHAAWHELLRGQESRLRGVRWVQSVDAVFSPAPLRLSDLQHLQTAPEADAAYTGLERLGSVVEQATALDSQVDTLLQLVLEGRADVAHVTSEAAAAAQGVALARGLNDTALQRIGSGARTPSPLKHRSPSTSPGNPARSTTAPHFRVSSGSADGSAMAVDGEEGLMSARDMAAALRAIYKAVVPCGLHTPAMDRLEQCAAELWWYSDVWTALRIGRPRLAALLEIQVVAQQWPKRLISGVGIEEASTQLDALVADGQRWTSEAMALVRPWTEPTKDTLDIKPLQQLLKQPVVGRIEMEAESSVRGILANIESYVGSAKAMLTGVRPGDKLSQSSPISVVDQAPLCITNDDVLQATNAAYQLAQSLPYPVLLRESAAIQWYHRLLAYMYKMLEGLDSESIDVVRLDDKTWKELRDDVLLHPEAADVLEPCIPAPVAESLKRLGVHIDAVDLSEMPPDAPLEPSQLDDANVNSLVDSPMCTYHVRGSTNRLLLQSLRLHALVKSKVERARQWQRTFKELASNTTGKPLIDEEQLNNLRLLGRKLGIRMGEDKYKALGSGAPIALPSPTSANGGFHPPAKQEEPRKRPRPQDGAGPPDKKAGMGGKGKTEQPGDKKQKKSDPNPTASSSAKGASSGDGHSKGSGVDCLAPGCRNATGEHAHHHHDQNNHHSYCSDACLLKTTPHLAKALGGVRATLSSAWMQRLLSNGKGQGQKPTALIRNLTAHHGSLLDLYTSTTLITPKQQEAGMRGLSSQPPLLSTLSAVLSDLSEQPPSLAKVKPSASFDSASTTGVKKKEALPVDQRERVRHALRETFLKGLQRLGDEASAASRCVLLAWELELELTRLIGAQDTAEKREAFRKKYMSLKFNLDDPKNPQLMEKVVNGVISMDQLCRLEATELASQEVKEITAKSLESAKKSVILNEGDVYFSKAKDGSTVVHSMKHEGDRVEAPVALSQAMEDFDSSSPDAPSPDDASLSTTSSASRLRPQPSSPHGTSHAPPSPPPNPSDEAYSPTSDLPPMSVPTFSYVSHAALLPDTSDQEPLPELPELGGLSDMPNESVPLPEGFKFILPPEDATYMIEPTGFKGQKPFHYRAYAHEMFTTEVHTHLGQKLRVKGRTKMKELSTYMKQCEVNPRFFLHYFLLTDAEKDKEKGAFESFSEHLLSTERAAYMVGDDANTHVYLLPPQLARKLHLIDMPPSATSGFMQGILVIKKAHHHHHHHHTPSSLRRTTSGSSQDTTPTHVTSPHAHDPSEASSGIASPIDEMSMSPTPSSPAPPIAAPVLPTLPSPPAHRPATSPPAPQHHQHHHHQPHHAPPPPSSSSAPRHPEVEVLSETEQEDIRRLVDFVKARGPHTLDILREKTRQRHDDRTKFIWPGERGHSFFSALMRDEFPPTSQAPPPAPAPHVPSQPSRGAYDPDAPELPSRSGGSSRRRTHSPPATHSPSKKARPQPPPSYPPPQTQPPPQMPMPIPPPPQATQQLPQPPSYPPPPLTAPPPSYPPPSFPYPPPPPPRGMPMPPPPPFPMQQAHPPLPPGPPPSYPNPNPTQPAAPSLDIGAMLSLLGVQPATPGAGGFDLLQALGMQPPRGPK